MVYEGTWTLEELRKKKEIWRILDLDVCFGSCFDALLEIFLIPDFGNLNANLDANVKLPFKIIYRIKIL